MEHKGRYIPPNRLTMRRMCKGLNQCNLSKKLKLRSSNRISRWEAGQANPGLENLFRLEYYLETTIQDLYCDLRKKIRAECSKLDNERNKSREPEN